MPAWVFPGATPTAAGVEWAEASAALRASARAALRETEEVGALVGRRDPAIALACPRRLTPSRRL